MKMWFYRFAVALLKLFFLLMPVRQTGKESMPEEGPVILCGNHLSMLDPLAAAITFKRPLRFMGKKELFEKQPLKWIVTSLGAFPVDRGKGDLSAIRGAIGILKDNQVLGIFPQGTRDVEGTHEMLPGVALIALRTGAPVIPMGFAQKCRLFHKTRLAIGEAVDLREFHGKMDSGTLKQATEKISEAIYRQCAIASGLK